VAIDLDDSDREARIQLAAALSRDEILALHAERIRQYDVVEWSDREQCVVARRVMKLDQLLLEDRPLQSPPAEATRAAMLVGLRSLGLAALPWDETTRALQARIEFVRALGRSDTAGWPAVSDAQLLARLDEWLSPWLEGITRRSHLSRLPLSEMLLEGFDFNARALLEQLAPTHLTLPTGSRVRVDYLDELAPSASMRMQEVFGLAETPRIGGGETPVTFKLLSPAQRPLQITRDLASFWRNAYVEVRKDMRGRYPRHYWPENPLQAEAVRGIRRKPRS
jgi:ATP-dependent helicase HrpB